MGYRKRKCDAKPQKYIIPLPEEISRGGNGPEHSEWDDEGRSQQNIVGV
jgi:hypothetical protein